MSYTTPKTWAVGDILGASDMNTYVRDNTSDLDQRANRLIAKETAAKTIASGAITIAPSSESVITVTGEGSADDTLDTINGCSAGDILLLLGDGSTSVSLASGGNIHSSIVGTTLSSTTPLAIRYDGSEWKAAFGGGSVDVQTVWAYNA